MRLPRAIFAMTCCVFVAACATSGPPSSPDGVYDPNETANRKVHAFNERLDKRLVRGSGKGYSEVVPDGVQQGVSNFADTVSLPQTVVNQILQGRLGDATRNTVRFTVNATLGFGGIADVAKDMGMDKDESDFGATLAAWGVPEGPYQVLPVLGPSTQRDTAGRVVDLFTDPLSYVVPKPDRYIGTAAKVLDKVGDRGRFSDTVDGLLYESADSYVQLRLIYLQNRRFDLGQEAAGVDDDPLALDTEGF